MVPFRPGHMPLVIGQFSFVISCSTHIPQHTPAPTVLCVLQLNQQAVGIREVQFRCSFFCAAAILHPHADVMNQWRWRALRISSWLDAVAFERLDDFFRIEIVHAHAKVIDAGGPGRSAGRSSATATAKDQELDATTHAEHWSTRSLIGLDPKTK